MSTTESPFAVHPPPRPSWASRVRTAVVIAAMFAIPCWLVIASATEEKRIEQLRLAGLDVPHSPSPDIPTGLCALALQAAALVIHRFSADRKPLRVYLWAALIPFFLGVIATIQEYRELDERIGIARLMPAEIPGQYTECWSHAFFGAAAGILVLLVIASGLIWPTPASSLPSRTDSSRFQFTLRTAFIVMTASAVGLSIASYFEQPALTSFIFAMVAISILAVLFGGPHACGLSVVPLCLCFGGICAVDPHRPHPGALVGLPFFVLVNAAIWFTSREKRLRQQKLDGGPGEGPSEGRDGPNRGPKGGDGGPDEGGGDPGPVLRPAPVRPVFKRVKHLPLPRFRR